MPIIKWSPKVVSAKPRKDRNAAKGDRGDVVQSASAQPHPILLPDRLDVVAVSFTLFSFEFGVGSLCSHGGLVLVFSSTRAAY